MEESKKQHHFVLVHGACHGAWCWYKVATWLRSEGHRVTAVDMAGAGANPKRAEEVRSISEYCEPLMELMEKLTVSDRVVLVGHSMGGICISVAMEKFPHKVCLAVFVTAFMPAPDLSILAVIAQYEKQLGCSMDTHISFSNGDDKPPTSLLFGPQFLASRLYQLSPPQDLTLATLLVRPLALYDESDLVKETALSKENYGSVRRVYLVCDQDNILKQEFQEWMIQNNPVNEVKIISDVDHMPMFSKSNELCAHLHDFAHKYC